MINQPLVSILVANYNNGKYFKDCYDSLISQTFTDWECIIVDDQGKIHASKGIDVQKYN